MELKMVLVVFFALTGLIAFLHFTKVPRSASNKFLGLFIAFFAFSIVHSINVNSFFQTKYNPLILIPLNLIFFPLYFLLRYFNAFFSFQVFGKSFRTAVLIIAFIELSTNLLPLGAWMYTKKFDTDLISYIFRIKRFFVLLLLPVSILLLSMLHRNVRKYVANTNDDKLRITWANECIVLLAILVLVIQLPELAYFFKLRSFSLFVIQGVVGAVMVIIIGLRNLNIQVVSAIETAKETNRFNPETNRNFYLLRQLFENEKIYRNPALRISDIAEMLSLSPNYVSKIINENAKMGFNDFTNQFRVNDLIEKLKNKEYLDKTIFALSLESGFKSKSTFQTSFKKITGKTPTEFINEIEMQ